MDVVILVLKKTVQILLSDNDESERDGTMGCLLHLSPKFLITFSYLLA